MFSFTSVVKLTNHTAHILGYFSVGVDVHSKGKLQLIEETAGGRDCVHGGAEHGRRRVKLPQVAWQNSLGGSEVRGGKKVPCLQEVHRT